MKVSMRPEHVRNRRLAVVGILSITFLLGVLFTMACFGRTGESSSSIKQLDEGKYLLTVERAHEIK